MIAQPKLDFSDVTLEEFERDEKASFDEKRGFMSHDEKNAWEKERARKSEQKRLNEERLAQERAARLHAIKSAIPYSESLAVEICGRISDGQLLLRICADENMPTVRCVNQWLKEHSDFAALYNDAIKDRLIIFEEQIIEISDDMQNDFKTIVKNGRERRIVDPEVIARAKLRVDSRHKYLKAYKPERWGEQSTLNVKQDDNSVDDLSLDELEKKIADLDTKNRIVKAV